MEFCPGIYEHAAALIGRIPWEVSRSTDLLVEAHHAAWASYGHRLVVVGIDVYNVEPEALGAEVGEPPGNNVPAIIRHPLEELGDLMNLPAFSAQAGRFPMILDAARALVPLCGAAEIRVPVCGPMAFANGLLGMENLLIGLMEDPQAAMEALDRLVSHQTGYLRAIAEVGVRPVFFESGTTPPLMSAAMFEEIEVPLLRRLFDSASAIFGERPPCIIGGDAAPIARAFLEAEPGYVIAPSETDQVGFIRTASAFPAIHVRVNMAATLLASGNWQALEQEARRALPRADRIPPWAAGWFPARPPRKPSAACAPSSNHSAHEFHNPTRNSSRDRRLFDGFVWRQTWSI